MTMVKKSDLFGKRLRKCREEKGYSLRKFADLVGVSPTYLSQVEQGRYGPPTVERVRRIAELLDEDVDQWTLLAGRLPEDLAAIIMQHPKEMLDLVREAGELDDDQISNLRRQIGRLQQ